MNVLLLKVMRRGRKYRRLKTEIFKRTSRSIEYTHLQTEVMCLQTGKHKPKKVKCIKRGCQIGTVSYIGLKLREIPAYYKISIHILCTNKQGDNCCKPNKIRKLIKLLTTRLVTICS